MVQDKVMLAEFLFGGYVHTIRYLPVFQKKLLSATFGGQLEFLYNTQKCIQLRNVLRWRNSSVLLVYIVPRYI